QVRALQALAAALPQIQWNGEYLNEYRIQPGARVMMLDAAQSVVRTQEFAIQLVKDPNTNAVTLDAIDAVKSGPISNEYDALNYHNVIVAIPPALLGTIAARPDVVSIEPHFTATLFDERQD